MQYSGVIYADPGDKMRVDYTPDIVYAHRDTRDLKLQLLLPFRPKPDPKEIPEEERRKMEALANALGRGKGPKPPQRGKAPLLIYATGSGWRGNDTYHQLPQILPMVYRGFAVAVVEYRGLATDHAHYPSAVQDVKEAIRFLRANADRWDLNPDRFGLMGDSSGGHTAAMAVLNDSAEMNYGENLTVSAEVQALALLYTPVDIVNLIPERLESKMPLRPGDGQWPREALEMFEQDFASDPVGILTEASPICHIAPEKKIPPVLVMRGDQDEIVPEQQTLRFCQTLRDAGKQVEVFKIAGGKHGPGCWPKSAYEVLGDFFEAYV